MSGGIKNVKTRICLCGVAFDTNNLGVGALISGLVKCARTRFPDAELFVLDYGKKPEVYQCFAAGAAVDVTLVNMRFSMKLFQWNNIVVLLALALIARMAPGRFGRVIVKRNNCLRAIAKMDIIGSIAGGDSFSDIYGLERLLYVALPQVLVLLCGKQLVQFPQTFGPYKGIAARSIARYILSRSMKIFSRDTGGLDVVRRLSKRAGSDGRIQFLYDVGFVMDPIRPPAAGALAYLDAVAGLKPVVGFNISGLLYTGGYTHKNMFHLKFDYREFVLVMIRRFIDRFNAGIVLVPHVFGAVESDLEACWRTYNCLSKDYQDNCFVVEDTRSQHEIKYIIGKCDFFTGARMHACIAALSQNVPGAAIAYSKKFFGVMDSLAMASMVVDPCAKSLDECVQAVESLYREREKYKKILSAKIPVIRNEILKLFSMIS
jgi:colanic acid/amylovoran biosynthesis protein